MSRPQTTIDQEEYNKFSNMAEDWWDQTGKFKALHQINPLRLNYIREQISQFYSQRGEELDVVKPLQGLEILDIGCGGGLVSEPLARLGAKVTGIDMVEKNIKVAKAHAKESGLAIDYRVSAIEELARETKQPKYDAIIMLEILEHVSDVNLFIEAASKTLKQPGIIVLSTINRTPKSLATAKIAAEYILRWVPAGTHSWQKFLRPSEVCKVMESCGLELQNLTGMSYNFFAPHWRLSGDLSVNYFASFVLTR